MQEAITYLCDACDRRLEVDPDLLGHKAACPFCGNVSIVRQLNDQRAQRGSVLSPIANSDRPTQMGLPADWRTDRTRNRGGGVEEDELGPQPSARVEMGAGQELHVLTVHPVTLRAKPLRGIGMVLGLFAAIAGGVWLYGYSRSAPVGGASSAQASSAVYWQTAAAVGAYACAVLVVAGLITLTVWWVLKRSVTLIITNRRTTLREGLFARHSREVLHDRVQDIQVTQTFLQRVLHTGSLGISNSGDAGIEIVAHDLPNPVRIRKIIDAYRGEPGDWA